MAKAKVKTTALGRRVVHGFEEAADLIRKTKLDVIQEVLIEWNNALVDGRLDVKIGVTPLVNEVSCRLNKLAQKKDYDYLNQNSSHKKISREMVYANELNVQIEALKKRQQIKREELRVPDENEQRQQAAEERREKTLEQAVIAAQLQTAEFMQKCQELERSMRRLANRRAEDEAYINEVRAILAKANQRIRELKRQSRTEAESVIEFPVPKRGALSGGEDADDEEDA